MNFFDTLLAKKLSGNGGGTSIENCFVGLAILPETQFDTLVVATGFAPKIVGAWVYDEVNELNTFSVVYGITAGNQDGVYFQEGGYERTYTADGTTDVGKGHIVGTSSTGFTVQTCEPYFAGKEIRFVAIG